MKWNDALTQLIFVGLCAFCCPGVFNSMQGLGGAGGKNADSGNAANTALYATFAICGYFGGPIFNLLGNRLCMLLGGLTYAIYSVCMYIVGNVDGAGWIAPLGGAILGAGAGIFWTAQGGMMLAYSTPSNQGKNISIFWVIFNLGGVVGGFLAFAINFNESNGQANPALYFTFIGIMAVGAVGSLFLLCSPNKVIKEDGTQVVITPAPPALEDIKGSLLVATNIDMLLLTMTFLSSNWFYTFQLNYLNGFLFNIRTRGLNSALYWGIQMIGAQVAAWIVDNPRRSAKTNAKICYGAVHVCMIILWAASISVVYTFEGDGYDKDKPIAKQIDLTDSKRAYGVILTFLVAGFADAMLQAFSYWMIGGVAKGDTTLAARYSGFYKGIQSAGSAVTWGLDLSLHYRVQMWIAIAVWAAGAITAYPAVLRVEDPVPAKSPSLTEKEHQTEV